VTVRFIEIIPITLALALGATACGNDFEPGSRIASPRILALQADQPYARPGETVALTLLHANPGREALQWAWSTCTLPESSTIDDCLAALDDALTPFDPDSDALTVTVPRDVLDDVPEDQRPSALIGVVVVACPGQLREGDTAGVPIRCQGRAGKALPIADIEVGVKRILLREHDRNRNPRIERITWDDRNWDADEIPRARLCSKHTFSFDDCSESLQHRVHVFTDARESGADEAGGEFAEQLIVQFYATHGLFRDEVRIADDAGNRWVAQGLLGGDRGPATLWFVVRDDRGGVSWAARQVELVPP
jgi:hypothetical protein